MADAIVRAIVIEIVPTDRVPLGLEVGFGAVGAVQVERVSAARVGLFVMPGRAAQPEPVEAEGLEGRPAIVTRLVGAAIVAGALFGILVVAVPEGKAVGAVVAGYLSSGGPYSFCPYGIDLEAFQRVAIESGVNTADRSLPISLILSHNSAQAAQTIDCYVLADALFYINSDGSMSVSV